MICFDLCLSSHPIFAFKCALSDLNKQTHRGKLLNIIFGDFLFQPKNHQDSFWVKTKVHVLKLVGGLNSGGCTSLSLVDEFIP